MMKVVITVKRTPITKYSDIPKGWRNDHPYTNWRSMHEDRTCEEIFKNEIEPNIIELNSNQTKFDFFFDKSF